MTNAPALPNTATEEEPTDVNDNKFLSFRLGDEEYGLEILRVREIIGVIDITPLPQTPEYIKGVINLRGKIIPVMELRRRFGLESVAYDEQTCIIVVEVGDLESDPFHMGIVVDTVSEVIDISKSQIEPAPRFGCQLDTNFILGMGKARDRVITLLAVEKVLSQDEMAAIASTGNQVEEPSAAE